MMRQPVPAHMGSIALGCAYASPVMASGPEGNLTFLVGIPGLLTVTTVLWIVGSRSGTRRKSVVTFLLGILFAACFVPDLVALQRAQHDEILILIFVALLVALAAVFVRNLIVRDRAI